MIQYYQNTSFSHIWRLRTSCGQFLDLTDCNVFCYWRSASDYEDILLTLPCVLNIDRATAAIQDTVISLSAGNYYLQCVLVDADEKPHIVDSVQFTVLTCPEVS